MAKNKLTKKQEPVDFDFMDHFEDMPDDETVLGFMNEFVEASSAQLEQSLELTKLVVEKSASASMSEEEIFSIYKRASRLISENAPLKNILEKA